ncbi:SDR family NAD(P)-dependent oxidoreductase [Brevundimonas sp. FT23042]|uniref:SDR family NAD(P)-dependent oxidoreductase n=1 Tax=Brevundimonas sp. FT23042 TaxID=3393749 RepID=UPI003B58776C
MTGGTSGLGAEALKLMAAEPDARILLGARGRDRVVPRRTEVVPLDLVSLQSVRAFADGVIRRLGEARIDVLILNAGLHGADEGKRSADGFELTFAVNHLAHYLIARLLLPYMAQHGRVVITSSNMHNPPFRAMAPRTTEPQLLAHPVEKGNAGIRAYSASKLCNLMTALSLSRDEAVLARQIEVIAFNPGLTGGVGGQDASGLQKLIIGLVSRTIFPIVGRFRPEFNRNTAEHSGRMLAAVALGEITPPPGRHYVSLVKGEATFPDPSGKALDRDAQHRLWNASEAMVGLS